MSNNPKVDSCAILGLADTSIRPLAKVPNKGNSEVIERKN